MDLRRVRAWDWLTGLAGLVALVSLWLPWYGAGGLTANAWEVFTFVDLILALAGLAGIALVVVTATQRAARVAQIVAACALWIGLVAPILAVIRLISVPDADITLTGGSAHITREAGAFIGTVAAIALTAFAWRARRDTSFAGPLRTHPTGETLPPPAAEPARHDVR